MILMGIDTAGRTIRDACSKNCTKYWVEFGQNTSTLYKYDGSTGVCKGTYEQMSDNGAFFVSYVQQVQKMCDVVDPSTCLQLLKSIDVKLQQLRGSMSDASTASRTGTEDGECPSGENVGSLERDLRMLLSMKDYFEQFTTGADGPTMISVLVGAHLLNDETLLLDEVPEPANSGTSLENAPAQVASVPVKKSNVSSEEEDEFSRMLNEGLSAF